MHATCNKVYGFDEDTWRTQHTRELSGFLGPLRRMRGYLDQSCLPKLCRIEPPYETTIGQRCAMSPDDGAYYFYSGFFGGSGGWMMTSLITLHRWTSQDWTNGYDGARVDDESYLNRLFWEQPPSTILTSAFMYPEPPSDTTHPWLWSTLNAEMLPETKPEREEGEVWERREWQQAFQSRVLRGEDCRRQLDSVPNIETHGRGGVKEAGEWEGLRLGGPSSPGLCWNVTEAHRWFKPVVLNLSKDKRALFVGSDKSKVLGLHRQMEEL